MELVHSVIIIILPSVRERDRMQNEITVLFSSEINSGTPCSAICEGIREK